MSHEEKLAPYLAHFKWGFGGTNVEQVYVELDSPMPVQNLGWIPFSGIWGPYAKWFFDTVEQSLLLPDQEFIDCSEVSDFTIKNGIVTVEETDTFRKGGEPPQFGVTTVDLNNLSLFCKNYEIARLEQRDILLYFFCSHR